MPLIHSIKRGVYFDSVSLMRAAQTVSHLPGVSDASLVMGTRSNRDILAMSGLNSPDFDAAGDSDLLIAIRFDSPATASDLLVEVDRSLTRKQEQGVKDASVQPSSLEGAIRVLPDANLALISVAGRYAGDLARDALDLGLHVMLFSDNVPVETEIELKRVGREKGLLVMGPDCGTAIVNGTPLGFANAVARGGIGIVAAAGTGLQEVSCLISNHGEGISQAIGVGGRDLSEAVGGIMFIESIRALDADPDSRVILLVSKPPHPAVRRAIDDLVRTIRKPVVSLLLGATEPGQPSTLEEAALAAVEQLREVQGGDSSRRGKMDSRFRGNDTESNAGEASDAKEASIVGEASDAKEASVATKLAGRLTAGRRYIRGLFSGGTFCAEAQIILNRSLKGIFSNSPTAGSSEIDNPLKSRDHTIVDLGDDDFTVGRLHPMIDFSLRKKRIADEAADSTTAVILLDVVLGYGSNPDPAGELAEVIREAARKVAVICSVTGTDADPQCRRRVVDTLREAGAVVMPSNAAACRVAGRIASSI